MTSFAGSREVCRNVIRVGCLIVLNRMAAITQGWGIGIIPLVASRTIVGNWNMCTGYYIIIIMNGEGCRFPARKCRMACATFGWNVDCSMVWICRLVEIRRMTAITQRRCPNITIRMAFSTFCCRMRSCQWEWGGGMVKCPFF